MSDTTAPLAAGVPRSPLLDRPRAVAGEGLDAVVAAHYGDPLREGRLLEEGLAVADLSNRGVVTLTGPDRLSWLHSITSQMLTGLEPYTSTSSLVLSPKGHIEHDLHLVDDGETLWITVEPGTAPALAAWLESMKFMMRVEIADVTEKYAVLGEPIRAEALPGEPIAWVDPWPGPVGDTALYGPDAPAARPSRGRAALQAKLAGQGSAASGAAGGSPTNDRSPAHGAARAGNGASGGRETSGMADGTGSGVGPTGPATGAESCLENRDRHPEHAVSGDDASAFRHPGLDRPWRELIVPRAELPEYVGDRPLAGTFAVESQRVQAWRPRLGHETDHRSIPHELDWLRVAVHLNKGCYRGQETVARVHNLGRPPRRLFFGHLDGSGHVLPSGGTELTLNGRAVGRLTTVARHHVDGPIALGVVRRNTPTDATLLAGDVAVAQTVIVAP